MSDKVKIALEESFKRSQKMQAIAAIVIAVDENLMTCDVEPSDGGAAYYGVRLRAAAKEGDFGISMIPKIGSTVLIGIINNDDRQAYVAMFSDLEKAVLKVENGPANIFGTSLQLNGKSHDGLIKAQGLFAEINKITARVDGIIDAINNAVAIPQDGGVGLQASMSASLAWLIDKENFDDSLINKDVMHGSGD